MALFIESSSDCSLDQATRLPMGEKEDEEGSTSTNDCDIVVNDTINHIYNDYVITDAVVVGLILSYVADCCHTWCRSLKLKHVIFTENNTDGTL